ncbi:MAG: NADH-quinone oxidoreductase subunit J family protein [Candidatus Aminicenantales bacterium]
MITNILFWILAVVSAGAAAAMILSKNPGHNALFLVLGFSALGGIFGLLEAPFAAAIQILVYAGAIMVLFIFVVMMIDPRFGIPPERRKRAKFLGALMGLILLFELGTAAVGLFHAAAPDASPVGSPLAVGRLLFSEYIYPFEITSVLILAALVGAVVLGKKEERDT